MTKNFLQKGDLIDIVCPASSVSESDLKKIKFFLTQNGLKARFYMEDQLLLKKKQASLFPAFSAKKRFEQLQFALENNDSKAVWCMRGGYGSFELISLLEKISKPSLSKIFIGFSDITSLAIFLQQKWGWKIIYGPMLTQLASDKVTTSAKKAIFDLIFGKNSELNYEVSCLSDASAGFKNKIEGKIIGGCLSVLACSFATSNEISYKDKLLFLEDIDESGEKIDRYFTQLIQVFLTSKNLPKALLLGNFSQGVTIPAKKKNIDFAIEKFAKNLQENKLEIPLFQEKSNCLGHAKNIMPLLIGGEAKIANNILTQKSVCIF